jgi:ankyrin repeat protein
MDPVVASDGFIYERSCIQEWLETNDNSPITKELMTSKVLHSVHIFNKLLNEHRKTLSLDDYELTYHDLIDAKQMNYVKHKSVDDVYKIIYYLNKKRLYVNNGNIQMNILCRIFQNVQLIDHLIDNKNPNSVNDKDDNGWTLLHYLCRFGDLSQIKKLLNVKNVDVEASTNKKYRPIHLLSSESTNLKNEQQYEAIELFVNIGVDLEASQSNDWRPIHFVCSSHNNMNDEYQLKAIKLLIMKDVNINVKNDNKWTPMHYVCSDLTNLHDTYQFDAIEFLISNDVDLEAENDELWRPIHFICSLSTNLKNIHIVKAIKLLIDKNVDLNAQNKDGFAPIHIVVSSFTKLSDAYQCDVIQMMIDKVNLRLRTRKCNSVLFFLDTNNNITIDRKNYILNMISSRISLTELHK